MWQIYKGFSEVGYARIIPMHIAPDGFYRGRERSPPF
jgi:hypothetical protein